MKKSVAIIALFASLYAPAQINTKGTKQLMFSIFTGDAQLVYKKYIKDGLALRYSIRGNYKYKKEINYQGYEQQYGFTNNVFSYLFNASLGFGFQKSIVKIDNKVDIYFGADLFLGNKYDKNIRENIVLDSIKADRNDFRNSQIGDYKKSKRETPLSITLDAVPFVGFKYFFHPRLAFGAECRMTVLNLYFIPVTYSLNEKLERGIYEKVEGKSNVYETGVGFSLNTTANITITLLLNKPAVLENKIEN